MNFISILCFSSIKLFGIGDTGDFYLQQILIQSLAQIQEMEKLLGAANLSNSQLKQAVAMAENMQRGIDKVIKPLEQTRQFKQALIRIGESKSLQEIRYGAEEVRDYLDSYERFFPERARVDQERRLEYKEFERHIKAVNQSDLAAIEKLETEIHRESARGEFSPGRASQISAQIQLKNWESQVLLREQIQRLLDENNTLREEVGRNRRREEIQSRLDSEFVQRRFEKGWGDGM
jgi:hypothetical protein